MMNNTQSTAAEKLTIIRKFNASKEAVFNALSNAEALSQWWGPAGSTLTVRNFDFKKGGKFHYRLEGIGQTMWGLFVYEHIERPDLIEFVSSFADEAGNVTKSPFPMDFPLEVFNHLELSEEHGMTTITLTGHPLRATPEQEATYRSVIPNMEQGFAGTMNQLEQYLAK